MPFQKGHKINLGRPSGMRGKKHSKETIEKIRAKVSESINKLYASGVKMGYQKGHPVYGGVQFTKEYHPVRPKKKKFCVDCNIQIKNLQSLRCRECAMPLVAIKNKGRKASKETRKKLRESHIGQIAWNKGKGSGRKYYYYPSEFSNELFREQIKKRDGYICRGCGITEEEHIIVFGYSLSLHHIDYNKQNCGEDNLITVCHACNARANHYNREQWTKFYQEKVRWIKSYDMGKYQDVAPLRYR